MSERVLYKVVYQWGHYLISAVLDLAEPLCVIYVPGEWALPRSGKLYVFDTLDSAMAFQEVMGPANYQVWSCEYQGEPLIAVGSSLSAPDYPAFWEEYQARRNEGLPMVAGARMVDAVKLLERAR